MRIRALNIFASMLALASFSLSAETGQAVEPAPSSIPEQLALPTPPPAPAETQRTPLAKLFDVKRGQSEEQVHGLLGLPLSRDEDPGRHRAWLTERWLADDDEEAIVEFKHHKDGYKVDSIRFWRPGISKTFVASDEANGTNGSAPSKAETVVGKVASVVDGFYLSYYCPKVYQRPLMWMTAAEYQLLQACNANGFMFFGMYLYTGGTR